MCSSNYGNFSITLMAPYIVDDGHSCWLLQLVNELNLNIFSARIESPLIAFTNEHLQKALALEYFFSHRTLLASSRGGRRTGTRSLWTWLAKGKRESMSPHTISNEYDDGVRRSRLLGGCFEEVARHEHRKKLVVAGEKFEIPEIAGITDTFHQTEVSEGQEDEIFVDASRWEEEIW